MRLRSRHSSPARACAGGRTKRGRRDHLAVSRRDNYQVEIKSDRSPVTVADRQSEEHLRRRIAANFPADGIVGEEFPQAEGTSNFRWILDPIDGTKSSSHAVPLYGTMIAVEHEGRSVVGAVLLPPLDELVYASVGQGAWVVRGHETPQPAKVSACTDLAKRYS